MPSKVLVPRGLLAGMRSSTRQKPKSSWPNNRQQHRHTLGSWLEFSAVHALQLQGEPSAKEPPASELVRSSNLALAESMVSDASAPKVRALPASILTAICMPVEGGRWWSKREASWSCNLALAKSMVSDDSAPKEKALPVSILTAICAPEGGAHDAGVLAEVGDAAAVAAVAPEGGVIEAGVLADAGDAAAVAAVAPEGGVLEAGVLAEVGDGAAVAAVTPEGGVRDAGVPAEVGDAAAAVALVPSEIMDIIALPMPQAPEATPPGSASEELPS